MVVSPVSPRSTPQHFQNLRGKNQGTFIAWDTPKRDQFIAKAKSFGVNIGGSGPSAIRLRPMLIFQKHHGMLTFSLPMPKSHILMYFLLQPTSSSRGSSRLSRTSKQNAGNDLQKVPGRFQLA
jgi:hypothetical protein